MLVADPAWQITFRLEHSFSGYSFEYGLIMVRAKNPIMLDLPTKLVSKRVDADPLSDADAGLLPEAIQESIPHLRPRLPWYDKYQTLDDTLASLCMQQARMLMREMFEMDCSYIKTIRSWEELPCRSLTGQFRRANLATRSVCGPQDTIHLRGSTTNHRFRLRLAALPARCHPL